MKIMEIEIRAFIENIAAFKKRLSSLGATLEAKKHIIDYWFCKKECSSFDEVQQHRPWSYALRIRETRRKGGSIYELNCKVLEKEGDHNAFHEYETILSDCKQAKKILESIGFKVFCVVDKKRTTYTLENCSINVEDINGFKLAVELEIISNSNVEKNKAYLKQLLDKLGIKEESKIEKSITFLYMKEFAFNYNNSLKSGIFSGLSGKKM